MLCMNHYELIRLEHLGGSCSTREGTCKLHTNSQFICLLGLNIVKPDEVILSRGLTKFIIFIKGAISQVVQINAVKPHCPDLSLGNAFSYFCARWQSTRVGIVFSLHPLATMSALESRIFRYFSRNYPGAGPN